MFLVKLDAINSTNTYLKGLSKKGTLKSWTVVTAEFQSSGRGQMQTKWVSERGKNLICSMLIQFDDLKIENQFYLNCAVSLGIYMALKNYKIHNLKIKWPNDIMSASKKIGGILIENSLKNDQIYQSIVGIGLNINQDKFPDEIPNAVSMKKILNRKIDRNEVLKNIVESIKEQIEILKNNEFILLHHNYEKALYKMNAVHTFEDQDGKRFVGRLVGVSEEGMLRVALEDEKINDFRFKEIKFL